MQEIVDQMIPITCDPATSAALGVAEAVAHGVTDWMKCEGRISLNTDQAIHLACKIVWFRLVIAAGPPTQAP